MSAIYATRFEAVFLCIHPKGPKMSISEAAEYMEQSESFVKKWVKRYKQYKDVDDTPEKESKIKFTFKKATFQKKKTQSQCNNKKMRTIK